MMDFSQLITDCKRNNAAAQKCVFDEFSGAMLLLCMRYVRKREDAEELMLNGFYKFFGAIQRFQYSGRDSIRAWLAKIMINECLMFLRKHNSLQLSVPLDENMIQEEAVFTGDLTAAELFELIMQLPAGYRTVFNLHVVDGLQHHEIAAALGISEGTSKSQLSKAKTALRQLIIKNITHERQQAQS